MITDKANKGLIPWEPEDFLDFFEHLYQFSSEKVLFLRNPKININNEMFELNTNHPFFRVTELLKRRYQEGLEEYFAKTLRFNLALRFIKNNEQLLSEKMLLSVNDDITIIHARLIRALAVVPFNQVVDRGEPEEKEHEISLDDVLKLMNHKEE